MWRQYTSLTPHPSLSAKIWISNPGRKSGWCLLGFQVPLVFWVMGMNSFFVLVFRHWKLMQKHRLPSFFLTSMTVLHHVLWLGLIAPDSNISLKCFLTSSTISGGICLNHSLNGVSSVTFMECSVVWVHPSSARSNENVSWYLARSQQALSTNSGAHESKPLRSNSSKQPTTSLPNCQLWSLKGRAHFIFNLQTPRLRGFRYWLYSHCPCHRGLLSESLGVGSVVPHHHYCLLAALPSVQYTYSAQWGQVARCHPGHAELAPSC